MRIVQLYEGYVRYNQNYAYSSVYVQLFDMRSMKIIAEGCRRAIYGTKSTSNYQLIQTYSRNCSKISKWASIC